MLNPETADLEASCSTRVQVTCRRIYPLNKLFEHWLIELGSQAYSKEKKSSLSYNSALSSLRLFPSELHSTKDAKTLLLHFGERICAELDKRLDKFRMEYGAPTLDNVLNYLSSENKDSASIGRSKWRFSPAKRQANGENTSASKTHPPETSNVGGVKANSRLIVNRRKSQEYVPRYRSGGYAILRALYENAVSTGNEWLETVKLQKAAQQFCNEYIGPSTRNQPFTAWASRKTLITKNLGRSMAEHFAEALKEQKSTNNDNASLGKQLPFGHPSPGAHFPKSRQANLSFFTTVPNRKSDSVRAMHVDISSDSKSSAAPMEPCFSYNVDSFESEPGTVSEPAVDRDSASVLRPLFCLDCGCSHKVMDSSNFHLTLLVDHSETKGGPIGRRGPVGERQTSRTKLHCALTEAGIPFEERDLTLVVDIIIERKRIDDLAHSIMGKEARYREQKFRLRNCGFARVVYLVEDYDGFASMADFKKAAVRGACSKTRVVDRFDVVKTANVTQTAEYLKAMTEHIRKMLTLPIWVCRDKDGHATFDEPANECCRKRMHCMQRFQQFSNRSRKQRPWTVSETFARMLLQFSGISAERAQEIVNLYPTAAHLIEAYRKLEEASNIQDSKEEGQLGLLANIQSGNCKRTMGKLSKNIDYFFASVKPFSS
uniref:Crossover junction endonuclease MUS81 n=1 Tax=Trichuris muris TaxID=70415 RepID=A0A5S6QQK7_TRIMR